MPQKIVVKSPTRVDLAGGTLDLWPLYLFINGASTVNVAIDVFTTVELTPHDDETIVLESVDLKMRKGYTNLVDALQDPDPKMVLLQTQLRYWMPKKGFTLKTSSDSPVGGGLGGSSSLTIGLMKAFSQFCERPFKDVHQMVHVAHNIEAEILNTPTGTQDYYPAASGGLNVLRYGYDGIHQEVLNVTNTPLAEKFMLIYTGKAHHSGLNNFEVMKDSVTKDPSTIQALKDLKAIAIETEHAVRSGNWGDLAGLFRREFEARVRLAPEFSSPEISRLAELSLQNGAEAVKICGAGGGGCVLVWCPPDKKQGVANACQEAGFQVMDAKPVNPL
ncbi:GHMP family kinase ATP-binding protein [Bdellovibrio svalbardensis]|uniref:Galactokinase n=1 Tax=Bdellovibrio svalbardensis TaxID=2972972 RepID=A0ABT6DN80_9BACT|nr:galactokinase [Bdellovibrio svalbardensis]MDG0817967.1 galactokinase [Bdellovibrio svalbardensis]